MTNGTLLSRMCARYASCIHARWGPLGAHPALVPREHGRAVANEVEVVLPTAERVDLGRALAQVGLVEEPGRPSVRVTEEHCVRVLGQHVLAPVLHLRDLDELARRPSLPVERISLAKPRIDVPELGVPLGGACAAPVGEPLEAHEREHDLEDAGQRQTLDEVERDVDRVGGEPLAMKEAALKRLDEPSLKPVRYKAPDQLLAFLETL
jgi:hypothetical protein